MIASDASREAQQRLSAARGVLFDLDGTLALGDRDSEGYRPLPGALELLASLTRGGRPFVIFTNGTHHTPRAYVQMLQLAGFEVSEAAMLTPAVVAAEYFVRQGYRRALVLGVPGVSQPLVDAGITVVRPGDETAAVDAVFVGWHPEFSLRDLEAACRAGWAGAALCTASMAPYFATRTGKALGVSGAICAAIKSVTRQRVVTLGKPSLFALRSAARRLGVTPQQMAVVGDDPVLEAGMARRGGAYAVGVMTGLATAEMYAASAPERRAQLVVAGVADLLPLFT